MDNIVQKELLSIVEYLLSIKRNTVNGWYEMEIGLPANYIYKSNKYVDCETVFENSKGKIINIIPKSDKVTIDYIVKFVKIIIQTNNEIIEKEELFTKQIKSVEEKLNSEYEEFVKEIKSLKDSVFKNLNLKTESIGKDIDVPKENKTNSSTTTKKRGRKPKNDDNSENEMESNELDSTGSTKN